ncbi:MAG TPA: methyltransferase domain-containing protein [Thermoanaerobaculia bacterium]|nr:methyltransferase domain-containing protein [Thermoanaerobaculia bacterium]
MGLGFGIRSRLVHLWRAAQRRNRQRARRPSKRERVEKLHIGSGPLVREGWTNIDLEEHPGVDFVLDIREGLPFEDVSYIYAEHFIEHLTHDEGLRFMKECRAALKSDGVLRLSTPSLDWVWETQYRKPSSIHDCFAINKSFRGWGHQFLYNAQTLTAALHDAGFADVREQRYGESDDAVLRDLERHERSLDTEQLPHVIIVEARGTAPPTKILDGVSDDYDWAVNP